MVSSIRRFWPPALWREIELLRNDVCFYGAAWEDLRAENADLRRKLETQQRRDHRGRFVGSVVRP